MQIHIHIHQHDDASAEILRRLAVIHQQGVHIMQQADELLAELATANEVTNEIATDLDDLITKQVTGGITDAEAQQIKSAISEHVGKLREVAAKYTAAPKTDTGGTTGATGVGGGTTT